ncbi:putative transposase [Gordonia terrae NBRC 100016]|nr:transposase [Gordonia terrae]GAB46757.1 putative transposase [Gordonia terrae NBRC 100016]
MSSFTGYAWMHSAGRSLPSGRGQGRTISAEVRGQFWFGLRQGLTVAAAARTAGVSKKAGQRWFKQAGGVRPVTINAELEATVAPGSGPLSWIDRCRYRRNAHRRLHPGADRTAAWPRTLDDQPGSGAWQTSRPADQQGCYRALVGQNRAQAAARRPKQRKLVEGARLYTEVAERLKVRQSPAQISGSLSAEFPDDPEMQVSHETIYQALYVQARGGLKKEVQIALRTGRFHRKAQGRNTSDRARFKNMVSISERPAEADDRAVPGHWEGDLIMGTGNPSAIGTLVERTTGFVMLLHLREDHTAETVAAAMTAAVPQIPEILQRSLTWNQGSEMALHTAITAATGLPIYFADPHSPWQRGSNENTNGLLRQYFPKGTDLSFHGPGILANVAAELDARPRKRHGWRSPAYKLDELLRSGPTDPAVAATG